MAGLAKKPEERPASCMEVLNDKYSFAEVAGRFGRIQRQEGRVRRWLQTSKCPMEARKMGRSGKGINKFRFHFVEKLSEPTKKDVANPDSDSSDYYVVQRGDYLAMIAKKYGMTMEMIMELNQMESEIIRPGQKIKVKARKP